MTTSRDVAEWLKSHDDRPILTHLHPDGDALGSSLAPRLGAGIHRKARGGLLSGRLSGLSRRAARARPAASAREPAV